MMKFFLYEILFEENEINTQNFNPYFYFYIKHNNIIFQI